MTNKKVPKNIKEYLEFKKSYKEGFGPEGNSSKGEIELLENPEDVMKAEENGVEYVAELFGIGEKKAYELARIGIRDKNRWGITLCDPVRFPDSTLGIFVRCISWQELEANSAAGVVVVPVTQEGKLAMIKTFRHATRDWQLEFPRGIAEYDIGIKKTIEKELEEEMGARLLEDPTHIGDVNPDTGILASNISCYLVRIELELDPKPDHSEAIESVVLLTPDMLREAIREGRFEDEKRKYNVKDAFTIFAFLKANLLGLI